MGGSDHCSSPVQFELLTVQGLNYMHERKTENQVGLTASRLVTARSMTWPCCWLQVALATVLKLRGGGEEEVLVLNTHLKASKDLDGEQVGRRR